MYRFILTLVIAVTIGWTIIARADGEEKSGARTVVHNQFNQPSQFRGNVKKYSVFEADPFDPDQDPEKSEESGNAGQKTPFTVTDPIHFPGETGYVNKISVFQGDTLEFHISTYRDPFYINIYKKNNDDSLVATIDNIAGGYRLVPDSSYYYGCNWPVSYSMVVPGSWPPGLYEADFPTDSPRVSTKSVLFMVKTKTPGSYSNILYLTAANTWNAYNPYGGESLYETNSLNGVRSTKVSFLRPGRAYGGFPESLFDIPFVRWLDRSNIKIEYAVNYDLHVDANLLSHYKVLVVEGHSEYWSYPERVEVEKFVRAGGNLIVFSGNTCWWQVRYEDNGNTMVCYKDSTSDPLFTAGPIDTLVGLNWYQNPINNDEKSLMGLTYLAGGYVNDDDILPASQGYGGYTTYNHHNWVFNGTGLMDGDDFGYPDQIVGVEVDGAIFSFKNGIPVLDNVDNNQVNFRVLGLSPSYSNYTWYFDNPHGMMGTYHVPGGGSIFNAATIYWANGFDSNYYVQTISQNVFKKFSENRLPPDIVSWSPFYLETANIHNEFVPLNKREYLRKDTSSVRFSVTAEDPYGSTVSYNWLINDQSSGQLPIMTFSDNQISHLNKKNKVTALVYNRVDTSSITWNYFNTELAFNSEPIQTISTNSRYFYKTNIFNYYKDQTVMTYQGPSWLSLTDNGELTGTTPGTAGSYPISIIVTNQHAQADTQSFYLVLIEPAANVTTYQLNITALIGGFYNGTSMQSDTITVELRNDTAPYTLVESKKVVLDTTGNGVGHFTIPVNNVPYYIIIKHRNAIETWSSSAQPFIGNSLTYDFTSAQTKAFGSNLFVNNGKWCIFNGDVNQDGIVDGTDLAAVDNDNNAFAVGYLATDLNGDGIVDGSDLAIVDNSNNSFIAKTLPPGALNQVTKKRNNTHNFMKGSNKPKKDDVKNNN